MRLLATALALTLVTGSAAYAADRALTEQEVEGVQKTIKSMDCTVEDTAIEAEGSGYEADDVICKDGQYDIYLDKAFKVKNKVKED